MSEVVIPGATAAIAGFNDPPIQVTLVIGVAGLPECTVRTAVEYASGASINQITAGFTSSRATQLQKALDGSRTSPDSTITMKDGRGGSLTFKGYLASFGVNVSRYAAYAEYKVIHESAPLSAFRMDAYKSRQYETKKVEDMKDVITGGAPAVMIQNVINKLIARDEPKVKEESKDRSVIRQKLKAINKPLIPILEKILKNSDYELEGLAGILSGKDTYASQETVRRQLYTLIAQMLNAPTSDFFEVLNLLQEEFQMLWVPSVKPGEYGKFIGQNEQHPDKVKGSVSVEGTGLNIQGGSTYILPVKGTMLAGTYPNTDTKDTTPDPDKYDNVVLIYPESAEEFKGGRMTTTQGPVWLPTYLGTPQKKEKPPTSNQTKEGVSLSKAKETTVSLKSTVDNFASGSVTTILENWTKNAYMRDSLQNTSTLHTLLDLTIEPGKAVNVTAGGSRLFTGFLSQVSHDLAIDGDNGSAQTVLNFSHVRF
jgi:hypothetical protein